MVLGWRRCVVGTTLATTTTRRWATGHRELPFAGCNEEKTTATSKKCVDTKVKVSLGVVHLKSKTTKRKEYYLPCVLIYTIKAKCFVNFYSKRKNIVVHLYLFNSTLTFNRGHGHLNKYECTKLKEVTPSSLEDIFSAKEYANFSFAKGKTCSFSLTHFKKSNY